MYKIKILPKADKEIQSYQKERNINAAPESISNAALLYFVYFLELYVNTNAKCFGVLCVCFSDCCFGKTFN